MNINTFLNYLDKVRPNGADKFLACCPAHDDKSPSMSIKDTGDKILIHCFAGCTSEEITGSIGLTIPDLFADIRPYNRLSPRPPRTKLEAALFHERLVMLIAEGHRKHNIPLHDADRDREQLAIKRITALERRLNATTK